MQLINSSYCSVYFLQNFIRKKEYKKKRVGKLFFGIFLFNDSRFTCLLIILFREYKLFLLHHVEYLSTINEEKGNFFYKVMLVRKPFRTDLNSGLITWLHQPDYRQKRFFQNTFFNMFSFKLFTLLILSCWFF